MDSMGKNNNVLKSDNGSHVTSYYAATVGTIKEHPVLQEDRETDVCIIGGGFTGLSAALHLAEQGVNVILLEAEKLSWGASGRNGGQVGVGPRVEPDILQAKYGSAIAESLWQLSLDSVELVADLIKKHAINCDLKRGILHLASKEKHVQCMKEYTKKIINDYGYQDTRFVDKAEVDSMIGSKKYFAGRIDNAAYHLHPLKYALGLADAATKAGVSLYEHSRVSHYQAIDNGSGQSLEVYTDHACVNAKTVILACNGYLDSLEPKMAGKIMPINNFVLATEPLDDDLANQLIRDDVAVHDSLYVLNYWKLSADNRLIFGGGENYTNRFPRDIKSFVRKYLLKIYPQLAQTKIDYAWGGTLAVTLNRMPHFGQLQRNIYYAQGYSGHGISTASMAGKLLADAICGKPDRFNLIANLPTASFPGGVLLRKPGLIAGMLYYALIDKF